MALYINGNKTGGGSGNADIVHLTQAEYDALPPTKLTDNNVYMITDVNGDGSQFQPVIYSEDEREIGVWIDGKPLYQKTFLLSSSVTLNKNSWTSVNVVIQNAENCLKCEIFLDKGDKSQWSAFGKFVNDTLQIFTTVDLSIEKVTIQYTKTTDTAGSGTWTPQGIPAVHYNTDEQVVGTWVDGNTVYQKTYVAITDTQYGSENAYLIGTAPSDLENVIDFEGSLKTSDGTGYSSLNGIGTIPQWDFGIHITGTNLLLYGGNSLSSIPQNATCIVTIKYTKTLQGGN